MFLFLLNYTNFLYKKFIPLGRESKFKFSMWTKILFGFIFLQNRSIVCFYGSQTGTSEEFATRLAKEASRYGMKAMVADPEECDMVNINLIYFFIMLFSVLPKNIIYA